MKKTNQVPTRRAPQIEAEFKVALIRMYQRLEGNYDCCATPYSQVCGHEDCLWRSDCLRYSPERRLVS